MKRGLDSVYESRVCASLFNRLYHGQFGDCL